MHGSASCRCNLSPDFIRGLLFLLLDLPRECPGARVASQLCGVRQRLVHSDFGIFYGKRHHQILRLPLVLVMANLRQFRSGVEHMSKEAFHGGG